jgi:hypothetical protein
MSIIRNGAGRRTFRTLVLASAAYAASAGFGLDTTHALPRYDGMWSVSIVTEKGDCDRGYRYPIRISNGTLLNGGAAGFNIAGSVTAAGHIKVTVSRGSASASGVGRLAGNEGGGSWKGGSCSGSWTAERRGS